VERLRPPRLNFPRVCGGKEVGKMRKWDRILYKILLYGIIIYIILRLLTIRVK
jgi:hypothetical protein